MSLTAAAALLALILAPLSCAAGSADGAAPKAPLVGRQLGVAVPVVADVEIFQPSGYSSNRTASRRPEGWPLLVFLHGFCLPDAAQQAYEFTALRANAGGGVLPRRQTLSQVGLRELVEGEGFLYATPKAPHSTRKCALCNVGEDSPNVADRLTVQYINQTMARVAPAFECPAWDGSDACCNPEQGGRGDDVAYLLSVVDAIAGRYDVDRSRVYLLGIATGGFMANRLACEAPEVFAGVATFAGATWSDPTRCDPPLGAATNVLNMHGTADLTVPIEGGANFAGVPFPSADVTVDTLAERFGCVPRSAANVEGAFTLPAAPGSPTGDVDVSVTTFTGCGEDRTMEVEQWTLDGVDHFLEEPTSRAMFSAAVRWLMGKTRSEKSTNTSTR